MKNKYRKHLEQLKPKEIQSTIMIAFTLISITIMMILGIVIYLRFYNSSWQEMVQSTQRLMEQTDESMEDYLGSMRQISDAIYYNIIKESDLSDQSQDIQKGMNLLYEENKDKLRSIAIYNSFGSLIAAEPVALQKEDPNVTQQDWFRNAVDEVENLHFSAPHIQNLFDDATHRYYWVISMSRAIELTDKGENKKGVLLVDMDFSAISHMMKKINTQSNGQYYYLCDSNGDIVYHPRQIQINDGIFKENLELTKSYKGGIYEETFDGEQRKIVVNVISYTGWKLVGVLPYSAFTHGMVNVRYFVGMIMLLMVMMLVAINRIVSVRISRPIMKLNDSVMDYEAGEKPDIYIGGPSEIRHLGFSIQSSYEQIDGLMRKIVLEQNERRKSELDALQSQINPHFLYNTLESITWMVEGERNEDAVFMISQLATLFRISLSKGHTVIRIREEMRHAKSYMNMQMIRYKNSFSVEYAIDPSIEDCCTVKLILQPLLENAINYGVRDMDDSGKIWVNGQREGKNILLSVEDNGMGMPQEEADLVLTDSTRVHKHGSGVGLVNINNRIQMMFGKDYGLKVSSEPDAGTKVSICFPAVTYSEENRKRIEEGQPFAGPREDLGGVE